MIQDDAKQELGTIPFDKKNTKLIAPGIYIYEWGGKWYRIGPSEDLFQKAKWVRLYSVLYLLHADLLVRKPRRRKSHEI